MVPHRFSGNRHLIRMHYHRRVTSFRGLGFDSFPERSFWILGCVCAFRCCGNLRPDGDTTLGQTFESVDTLKSEVIKRGSLLRRSLSRSPKLSHHQTANVHRLDHAAPLIQSQLMHSSSSGMPSPTSAASRQLLASMAAQQQMPKRTNMARLASPYYGAEDGHSMV